MANSKMYILGFHINQVIKFYAFTDEGDRILDMNIDTSTLPERLIEYIHNLPYDQCVTMMYDFDKVKITMTGLYRVKPTAHNPDIPATELIETHLKELSHSPAALAEIYNFIVNIEEGSLLIVDTTKGTTNITHEHNTTIH